MELKWFELYLTNRKQITKVNDINSHIHNNEYDVPHGSILGALLFILFIPNIMNKCKIVLCADDTLICTDGESEHYIYT